MIFVQAMQSGVAMSSWDLWWSNYGNYALGAIVAITVAACYFVLRKKE